MTAIQYLAKQVGFHNSYFDSFGNKIYALDEASKSLLKVMGYAVETEQQIDDCINRLNVQPWLRILPVTKIINSEDEHFSVSISVNSKQNTQNLQWQITTEDDHYLTGNVDINKLALGEEKNIQTEHYYSYELPLPKIAEGYHSLSVSVGDATDSSIECQIIVAPKTCYGPKDITDNKMWGLAVQLYSLKSDNSWGIGDLGDLHQFIEDAAKNGVSAIGLNPLHPLFPGNPAHRSPYSPSSRNFLNSIYIDVSQVVNFNDCIEAQQLVNSTYFQQRLKKVNDSKLINYQESAALKYQVLELLYKHFINEHINKNTELCKQFTIFCNENSPDLKLLTTFDALYEYFLVKDCNAYGWTHWPTEYQDPTSSEVSAFQIKNAQRIGYFEFIQWIVEQQLEKIAQYCKQQGMQVGLYLDLAVGCEAGGADVWSNRALYVDGGSVGAPPDIMNRLGQDWGLAPINPVELKKQEFKPLIKVLQSNMKHAGALRIDHMLGYMRQHWIAPGLKADQGLYISFPFEEMLRIIALESRRAKCIVIGEDLGVIPDGFGKTIADAGLLSYRVLYFECWENGLFKRPDLYPEQSMVTVSTHDLPTLKGWWNGTDLAWRDKLNLYPNEQTRLNDINDRAENRQRLIAALQDLQLLNDTSIPSTEPAEMNDELAIAVQQFLSKTPSKLQLIPLEDALCVEQQVNIPGTIDEHPNWLQRLDFKIDEIWQQTTMKNLVKVMQQERNKDV